MKPTRICDIFNIKYPIIQGGMVYISSPELVAAVSNAGGLGLLSGLGGSRRVSEQIKRTQELTSCPFGINIPIGVYREPRAIEDLIGVMIEQKVNVAATAAGSPIPWVRILKDAGFKVMHVVPTARLARRAEGEGADAIVASGFEGGGHVSRDQVTTMVLVPAVARSVSVPVIAAGGISDGNGVLAAFALGAEGVQMGTRFIATHECSAPQMHKEALLKAKETDTEIIEGMIGKARVFRPDGDGGEKTQNNSAAFSFGQGAGLISEIKSVSEIFEDIIRDYDCRIASL